VPVTIQRNRTGSVTYVCAIQLAQAQLHFEILQMRIANSDTGAQLV
jgi:hypothetical protein